ncbi:MAG: CBS domain-containing protein, partial [Bacteroidota bacterium]
MSVDVKDIDEELKEMYEEGSGEPKVLNSETLKKPIRSLQLPAPIVVQRGTSVSEAVRQMQERHIGCVLVVQKGVLDGIFTERDILMKIVGAGKDISKTKVEE